MIGLATGAQPELHQLLSVESVAVGMRPLMAYGHFIPPSLEPIVGTIRQSFESADNFPWAQLVSADKVAQR